MFKRNIENNLKAWLENSEHKPIILRGARQVGKTTAVNRFAKNFDQYIYLNLEYIEDRNFFLTQRPFSETLAAIFFHKNIKRDPSQKTLIFIDEIQNSMNAMAMMRYFFEETKDLFVVAAGSLLETLIAKQSSFPVGRVDYMYLYPLTFCEYLEAIGQHEAVAMYNTVPIPAFAHEKLLTLFHQYTLIGGMPEVVNKYVNTNDIVALNACYHNLMAGYVDDIDKYASNAKEVNYLRHSIEHVPLHAGTRIKFQGFGNSNYGSREMSESLNILEKALLIKLIYPTTSVIPPISPNYHKSPKLQFLDTGLLNYSAGLQKYFFTFNDLNAFYQGTIAEHIVGQELIAANICANEKPHFWVREKKQANAEVDFVIPFNNFIIPIEVKSGKAGTLRSMHQFIDATNHTVGVRLSANNFKIEQTKTINNKSFTLLNIPYYLAAKILNYLEYQWSL